ncbi:MAG: riboflavin synthase [Patescibacteria group bacterium]
MFTGIITHTGEVVSKRGGRLGVKVSADIVRLLKTGASVSVDGACLTVTSRARTSFEVDVMPETFRRTALGDRAVGNKVNMELPIRPSGFISGHIVQGHIDGVGTIRKIKKEGNSYILTIEVPQKISRYLVGKGSVTVNGVALTVIDSGTRSFTTGIIPHTWANTTLRSISVGDAVNIEVDIIAKYVAKFASVYEK